MQGPHTIGSRGKVMTGPYLLQMVAAIAPIAAVYQFPGEWHALFCTMKDIVAQSD